MAGWSFRTYPDRFWAKVERREQDDCWPWLGCIDAEGYGRAGQRTYAHRVAYELANQPIPDGLLVMHTCDNRPCCNPTHLVAGTHGENMLDAARKGLIRNGSRYDDTGALRQAAAALSEAGQALDAAARALLRAVNEGPELAPSAAPPLHGSELARVAVEVARGRARPDEEMHYRDWFALLERAGYRVGGRDPLATFLTALSRAVEVEQVGGRSGLYRLRAR